MTSAEHIQLLNIQLAERDEKIAELMAKVRQLREFNERQNLTIKRLRRYAPGQV